MIQNEIRYISLGDSYTSGEGVQQEETYPSLLTSHLRNKGLNIKLIANLAVSGFTTKDVLNIELPQYEKLNPTFATLLIGANDINHSEINKDLYRQRLMKIINNMQDHLPKKNRILLLTIPNFSITPYAKILEMGKELLQKIEEFNNIIKEIGNIKNLTVIDIFPLSKEMGTDSSLIVDDIHPSEKEYKLWEEIIFPVAWKLLKKK
ncbi:SGNH/GDSL hydrolase family protein [Candidatus Gottesmanbacteria bacterium]|nr:SGNH/GDSL hydrolase family protein [Candidatus Gottesmanbacteria bacterium]